MVAIRRHIRCVWWHRCCKITVPIVIPVYTNTPQSLLPWGEEAYKTNTISLKLIRDACEHTLITSNKFFIKFYEFFFTCGTSTCWENDFMSKYFKIFHVKVTSFTKFKKYASSNLAEESLGIFISWFKTLVTLDLRSFWEWIIYLEGAISFSMSVQCTCSISYQIVNHLWIMGDNFALWFRDIYVWYKMLYKCFIRGSF